MGSVSEKYRVTTNSRHSHPFLSQPVGKAQSGLGRRPEEGMIFHSDRGVQYASHEFRRLLIAKGILGSMSQKGDCWDNSVVESFFGKLKSVRVHWRNYQTCSEARADVLQYITMRHNSLRIHSYLGYLSPDEFERRGQPARAA